MMYPFLQLEDGTEIVHSEIILDNETEHVKVYIERPIEGGKIGILLPSRIQVG